MKTSCSPSLGRTARIAAFLSLAAAAVAFSQVVVAPTTPQIGSSNPVTAAPLVPRPNTKPCVVQLFNNLAFADYNLKSFSYTPPAACPGPWAKVVFTADFTVSAGTQFDRTAAFYLGHANIYYGTTAEPRSNLSPSWHVEHDVTDLTSIFLSPQTGEANLGNFVGVYNGTDYNGVIYANAALEFYPISWKNPAPLTPDVVVPVNGTGGDAGTLNTGTDTISQTLNLPTNVERVYLDVIAQSQINDEFWYFCVPNDQTSNLESCGNTAFRETEIWIDGKPAGVAPVYPWIFTGGIDPFLWEPIPGIQTLDFKPYRVDLTPFAGVLSDGGTHTVAVSVYNANSYFLATGNLLVFEDHGAKKVTGGIMTNTLTEPNPVVSENIVANANSTYTGTVTVGSNRSFTISGWVNTSHGRVETTVDQRVDFLSRQEFDVDPVTSSPDIQNAQQTSTLDSTVTTRGGWFAGIVHKRFSYPLNIDFSYMVNADGSLTQTTTVDQQDLVQTQDYPAWGRASSSDLAEHVNATDTLEVNAAGVLLPPSGHTTESYRLHDPSHGCYDRTITAENQVLVSVRNGPGCENNQQ